MNSIPPTLKSSLWRALCFWSLLCLPPAAAQEALLPPERAFALSTEWDGKQLHLTYQIAPDYYLYRDRFRFNAGDSTAIFGSPVFPPGQKKHDEFFGEVETYRDKLRIALPMAFSEVQPQQVNIISQGCADIGICFPPYTHEVVVTPLSSPLSALTENSSLGQSTLEQEPALNAAPITSQRTKANNPPIQSLTTPSTSSNKLGASTGIPSPSGQIAKALYKETPWLITITFFGFGLLLAFTPCVLPMIPILSSIVVGGSQPSSSLRAFTLSAVYVMAMAITYAAMGVMAGLFGANFQATLQNPWVLSGFSVLFALLALSMFGFYELRLPTTWQTKLSEFSHHQTGGTWLGVVIMGVLSTLIVSPCVTAPLTGALIYIGQSGNAWLGGSALFAMGLGMGAPLLVIGTSAGFLLPKAGVWMDTVKKAFGVLLLGVAIYLLERILPEWITLLLWAALFIVSAVYLGALDELSSTTSHWRRWWKGIGLVILGYGLMLMIGAGSGQGTLLRPLAGAFSSAEEHQGGLTFRSIKGPDALQAALVTATAMGRPIMLDYYADWCVSCKEMARYTFTDPRVQAVLGDTLLLQTDVTAFDAEDKALLKRFGLYGPPAILFFSPQGIELSAFRIIGFINAERFVSHVRQVLDEMGVR